LIISSRQWLRVAMKVAAAEAKRPERHYDENLWE
jgi:hypothetical protein